MMGFLGEIGRRVGRRIEKARRRRQSRFQAPYRELERLGIISHFRGYPRKAIKPEWDDLHGIYLLVMERRPAVIVELGGGYSTFVIAHAVRELVQQGHTTVFWTVDESPFWQDVVRDRMPKGLLPFIKFWHSEPKMIDLDGESVAMFERLPVEACNFVYVDGGLPEGHKRSAGADAYLLEANAPPDYAVLVDGRAATCSFLERKLRYQYDIGTNAYGVQTLFTRRPQ